jgi:GntR family transcriptional regulator
VGDSYLPVGRFPGLRDADFAAVLLSGQNTGRKVERTRQWIGAASPADVAALLELEPGAPVLRLDRVACVLCDLPIESVTAFFHSVRYQHHGELSLRPEGRRITNEELPATRSDRRLVGGSKPKPCGYEES